MPENNLLDGILGGDFWLAICDQCRQSKAFRSERERDLWDRNHAHQEDPS